MTIKGLSVKQPWAWALVTDLVGSQIGNKMVENRSWGTPHRGPLLVVASQRATGQECFEWIEAHTGIELPSGTPYMQGGMILGVVDMIACLSLETYERCVTYAAVNEKNLQIVCERVDRGKLSVDRIERTKDPWAVGPSCHVYANVRRLPPTRATGRRGLFSFETVGGELVENLIEREAVFVR